MRDDILADARKRIPAIDQVRGKVIQKIVVNYISFLQPFCDHLDDPDAVALDAAFRVMDKPDGTGFDRLSYSPITNIAQDAKDTCCIELCSDGWMFSGKIFEELALKVGERYSQLFVDICGELRPTYASILHESNMYCVTDLAFRTDILPFKDFVLGDYVIDGRTDADIGQAFDGAYVRRIASGIYVSTSRWFNPDRVHSTLEQRDHISRAAVQMVCERFPQLTTHEDEPVEINDGPNDANSGKYEIVPL